MPDYLISRAVVPPNFNYEDYQRRSNEPIRFDVVTVVEAKNPQDAVNALIAATGIITTGFAVVECTLIGFGSQSKLAKGGKLVADFSADTPAIEENSTGTEHHVVQEDEDPGI